MKRINEKKVMMAIAAMSVFFLGADKQVWASNDVNCKVDQIVIGENECDVYINQSYGEDFYPDAENSAVVFGNQTCNILSITNLNDAGEGVVYDCIVDVSGSMDQERIATAKEMLHELVATKKEQDVFRITRMGNERNSSEFLNNPEEIDACIDEIELTKEDTNLYDSLKAELIALKADDTLPSRRCLIIFSDGAEDQATGITREEAEQEVTDSEIPIFTIAMLKKQPTDAQLQAAKILGSFARDSFGGMHFAPEVDEWEYNQINEKIQKICNDSIVVAIDLSQLKPQSTIFDMELTLSDGDNTETVTYAVDQETGMEMLLSGQPENKTAANDTVQESENTVEDIGDAADDKTVMTEENSEAQDDKNIPIELLIVIAIVIVIICLCVVFILGRSKKKKYTSLDNGKFSKPSVIILQRESDNSKIEEKFSGEIAIGRGEECDISLPEDTALSEIHCAIIFEEGNVYIEDRDSTNGTYINGIPRREQCLLNQGDVLLIGSSEYTISWR